MDTTKSAAESDCLRRFTGSPPIDPQLQTRLHHREAGHCPATRERWQQTPYNCASRDIVGPNNRSAAGYTNYRGGTGHSFSSVGGILKRILVADDDLTTRQWISQILRAEKFAVTTVADGRAAWKKIQRTKFDLVLLDVWMPKMNGLDVLAAMRGKKARPKVIVITSDDTPGTLLGRGARAGLSLHRETYRTRGADHAGARISGQETAHLPPIEVISARPEWVELSVPCSLEAGTRLEAFMEKLDTGCPMICASP